MPWYPGNRESNLGVCKGNHRIHDEGRLQENSCADGPE